MDVWPEHRYLVLPESIAILNTQNVFVRCSGMAKPLSSVNTWCGGVGMGDLECPAPSPDFDATGMNRSTDCTPGISAVGTQIPHNCSKIWCQIPSRVELLTTKKESIWLSAASQWPTRWRSLHYIIFPGGEPEQHYIFDFYPNFFCPFFPQR